MKKIVGILLIIVSIGIGFFVWYSNSKFDTITREFSSYTLLSSSWEAYKGMFINDDGRVIDFTRDEITTSEGQSYAMLRSVWIDDKETFDLVWTWTKENLKRPDDNLFGWKWGERMDGTYGFLQDGGENSASDADQDIALALILASRRWSDDSYRGEAIPILSDLWSINTAAANGKRYLIAGNWAESDSEIVLNPSYFAPYAWRVFATVDPTRNWESMIDPGYELLRRSGEEPLDTEKGVGLPPDWVVLNKQTGELRASDDQNLSTNYSFDALRVPFRIALDLQWNNTEQAKKYLTTLCQPLESDYRQNKSLVSTYAHDGTRRTKDENPSMYATSIGCFMVANPDIAKEIYNQKIVRLYANDQNTFRADLPYYEQNLLWFGAALYNKTLIPYTDTF